MKCWKCGFEMPQDAIFCSKCGSNLSKAICESCGKQIPLEAKFCIFCGSKVHSIEEKRAAESLPKSSDISQKESVKQTQQMFTEKQDKANALASKEQAAEKKDNLSEIKPIVDHGEEPKRSFSWNNRKGTSKVSYSLTKMDVDFKEKSLQVVKTKGKNEEKTEILYENICGTECFTRISPLYMPLVIIILLLLAYMMVSGAAGAGGTLAILALFIFMCWNFSFQICHFDLVITEKNGKRTVISCKKQKILLEIMDMVQAQAGLISPENIKKASVLTKKEVYYGNQFRSCERRSKCSFHWVAFFFGPFFCFYRSGGKLFREFFQTFFVLLAVTALGFSFSLEAFASTLVGGLIPWLTICWIWFGILSIYGLYCAIRCGKEFNCYYFHHCTMLAGLEESNQTYHEASWKKAILSVILYGIFIGVLVAVFSTVISNAMFVG